jgi:hypothetical protein
MSHPEFFNVSAATNYPTLEFLQYTDLPDLSDFPKPIWQIGVRLQMTHATN